MSYSFSVRGTTEREVMKKVDAELDKVEASQPIHAADRMQARTAVMAFVNIVPEPNDKQDFYVSVSGSVGWSGNLGSPGCAIISAGVSVSASLVAKEKA